jgi:two-component system sensor histidine kinase KdpD
MTVERPNPDELLVRVAHEEVSRRRGKLKIFFGSNAGVGKTYAMLDEARNRAAEGMDVLIGYAEQHIRPETEALLLGLDILPYKLVEHRGATLKEFDLDAALKRRPALVCVDELAHTNAPGLRHPKRWQDVEEMLDAGINVYTTLNVQHLESVNDIVERITGIVVRETLPDRVLEAADEVELVDISPDELTERLREGKIYRPQQVEHALKHFFNKGNLHALRELALRKTAERVDAQMQDARRAAAAVHTWAASERILVCVGPSPFAQQLVRNAKRLATALRAPWYAVSVETPQTTALSDDARVSLTETLSLAERLGAEVVTLSGSRVAEEILAFARQKNITKIVVGKPELPRWREWLVGAIVDDLIRGSGSIDVYVIRHEREAHAARRKRIAGKRDLRPYGWSLAVCAAATLAGMFAYHTLGAGGKWVSDTNALMIHLIAVLFVATRFGRGPAIFASLVSVAAFDFTVVPPYYTFSVADSQYLFTFAVMLVTALTISTLADQIRRQAEAARNRERRTAALFALSRDLAGMLDRQEIARAILTHVADVFDATTAVFMPNAKGELAIVDTSKEIEPLDEKELGVVQWVFDHGHTAGQGTDTLPASRGLFLPMKATHGVSGVLGLLKVEDTQDPDRLHLLEAFANQSAIALERATLAEDSRRAWERVEAEFLRNTLLSGVSHDLRTPLATIAGAASSLADPEGLTEPARQELAREIVSESDRMERLITNLLNITRLESGGFALHKEWHPLAEILGSALTHLKRRLAGHRLTTHLAPDLPMVHVDALAIEEVLSNLLDNAGTYTPPGTPVEITASSMADHVIVDVADRGPGLPDPSRVFEKFYRGQGSAHCGAGLGLAICRGIVELHGGTITAMNRPDGGAAFRITLPIGGTPPPVPAESQDAHAR